MRGEQSSGPRCQIDETTPQRSAPAATTRTRPQFAIPDLLRRRSTPPDSNSKEQVVTTFDITEENVAFATALAAAGIPAQVIENPEGGHKLAVSLDDDDRLRAAADLLRMVRRNPELAPELQGVISLLLEGVR